ncbi:hypothetical protein ACM66B_000145 [Microbotryomycetes sp. NB124-2]
MPDTGAGIDLSPLAFLHQVIHTVDFEEAFVAFAELRRPDRTSNVIHFTVCLGLPASGDGSTRQETWWSRTWTNAELDRMFDIPGSAVTAKDIPSRFAVRWNEGHLHLASSPRHAQDLEKALTLEAHLTDSLSLPLKLRPSAQPSISPLSVVAKISKDAHDAVASRIEARNLRKERDALQATNQKLDNNLKRRMEELQNVNSRSTHGGASQTSPKKVNAALMRKRAGQQVRIQTDDFQPESDSD